MGILFRKHIEEPLPYLDRVEELPKVSIIRLKGLITRDIIPVIEARIQANRKTGAKIDKNVIVDFAKVKDVDSATVAFHIIRLEEFHANGFEIGFININDEMKGLLDIFKEKSHFKVFQTEQEAVTALNR